MDYAKRKIRLLFAALMIVSCGRASMHNANEHQLSGKHKLCRTNTRQENNCDTKEKKVNSCPDLVTAKYRTIDGTCNHVNNLGATLSILENLLPPEYDDGYNSPRQRGVHGQPLPSARDISLKIHTDKHVPVAASLMGVLWSQWLVHDLSCAAIKNDSVHCCGPNGRCPPFTTHPYLQMIRYFLERAWIFYELKDLMALTVFQQCPNSSFGPRAGYWIVSLIAVDGPRQQYNLVTSFHDCSQIYGSTEDIAESVRKPGGFLLRTKHRNFPPESHTADCSKRQNTSDYCFLAGDSRVNQHTYLSAMHTLWLREHNYIAKRLRKLKPAASNEEIFQLTRKIIIGMNQVITYVEFIPIAFGTKFAVTWNLMSNTGRSQYNPSLSPLMTSAFSAAGFRTPHSVIPSLFPIGDQLVPLRFLYNSPGIVRDNFDGIFAGMAGLTSKLGFESSDRYMSDEISKVPFVIKGIMPVRDLVSVDIQRGRDFGLAPYVKWRSFCGLRPLTGFNDTQALGPDVQLLGELYKSIEDIDAYTGMLLEPLESPQDPTGPTIQCFSGIQLSRVKFADRFFFDNTEPNSGFTDAQLASLRETTLAQVICRHTSLCEVQKEVFLFDSECNATIEIVNVCNSTLEQQAMQPFLFLLYTQKPYWSPQGKSAHSMFCAETPRRGSQTICVDSSQLVQALTTVY